jgi:hypothetical protein
MFTSKVEMPDALLGVQSDELCMHPLMQHPGFLEGALQATQIPPTFIIFKLLLSNP